MKKISSMNQYAGLGIHTVALAVMLGREIVSEADAKTVLREIVSKYPPIGHVPQSVGQLYDDQVFCSCGWKSSVYRNSEDQSWGEWTYHMASVLKLKIEMPSFARLDSCQGEP